MNIEKIILKAALVCAMILMSQTIFAADPGKPDSVITDSVTAKSGQHAIIAMKVMADDSIFYNKKMWTGIGSLCLPLKYDSKAFKVDSVKFTGAYSKWDEKFTNAKIDTGFVSFAGIYTIASSDRPVIFSPDSAETVANMYITVNKDSKPGAYLFEMTDDPIQKDPYLGSTNGMDGWRPIFVSGKIVIEK